MPLPTFITDGERSNVRAGVTGANALKVSIQEQSAAELPIEILTIRKQFRGFLETPAGSSDLNVDGSVTPVEFLVGADVSATRWITGIRILLNDISMELDTNDFRRFGTAAIAPGLTNGLEIYVEQSGFRTDLYLDPIKTIGDFMNYADRYVNFINAIGTQEDFLSFDFDFDVPVVLPPGSLDKIAMVVNDDLTPVDLFNVIVRGYQELGS